MRFSKALSLVSSIHTANSPITEIVHNSVICDVIPSLLLPQVKNRPRTTASSVIPCQRGENHTKDTNQKHHQKKFNHHKSSSNTKPSILGFGIRHFVSIAIAAVLFIFVLVVITTATALAVLAVGAPDIFVPSEHFGHRQHCEDGCHYR